MARIYIKYFQDHIQMAVVSHKLMMTKFQILQMDYARSKGVGFKNSVLTFMHLYLHVLVFSAKMDPDFLLWGNFLVGLSIKTAHS